MAEKKTSRYSPEFRECAVRLLDEHRLDYPSLSAACREIGGKVGCSGDSLHDWWKQTGLVTVLCRLTERLMLSTREA